MKKYIFILFLITLFYACSDKAAKRDDLTVNEKELQNTDRYQEFQPDTISNITIDGFEIVSSQLINDLKIVTGYFIDENIDFSLEEPLDDYGGIRLIALNSNNEIIYQSKGGGDIYLFHPRFYKNRINDKTLIICQVAFEYFCGGDVFLIENNRINEIGNLDIESDDMEISMTDIVKINERNNQIIFEFQKDSLIVEPCSTEKKIKNVNTRYIYEDHQLTFHE